jgi:Fic family protein
MRSAIIPHVSAMEPLFPEGRALSERALQLIREASALGAQLHPVTRRPVADLLRSINTYHSNLIEGHNTRPRDIERALDGNLSSNPERRSLQLEARAHVEVQRLVEARLDAEPSLRVTSPDFLCFLHRAFYERMPKSLRRVSSADGKHVRTVDPGRLRDVDVEVGRHVPPAPAALPRFLERFDEAYDPARLGDLEAVVAIAASHQRLLWIHPFLDGNGRVARLYTDACLRRAGLGGHGLWTASRGLARHRARYFGALAAADAERRNDDDGRGARSAAGLVDFCQMFLDICLDQVTFMGSLLELDGLLARIEGYVSRRAAGGLGPRLPPEASLLIREAVLRGGFPRGDAARAAGASGRSARRIVSALVKERLLVSDTPKGPLHLGLPVHVVGFYFPQLYPEDVL